ncbi:MAG: HlyD family secretion protein [Paludibacteraceae bacterium]
MLNAWEQNYVLVSPQKGIVTFNSFWKQNQYVKAGDKVLAIVPNNSGKFIGKIKLPIAGSGKVEIGQKVNVKITGYPYMEFGMLKGKIKTKSLVSNDNFYTLEVELTKGLHTTTGKI